MLSYMTSSAFTLSWHSVQSAPVFICVQNKQFFIVLALQVLVLRNYGVLVGGQTIEEAFYLARNLMTALDVQVSHNHNGYTIKKNLFTSTAIVANTVCHKRAKVCLATVHLLMRLIGRRLSSVSLATLFKLVGCVVYTDIVCHNTTQSCSVARTELSFVRSTWCETFHVCTALSGHCHQLKTLTESSH